MLVLCLCTVAGAYSLILIPQLPAPVFFQVSLVAAIFISPFGSWRPVTCFLTGFAIMGFSALEQKSDQLDPVFQGESVAFSARVEDFPVAEADSIRFIVRPIDRDDLPNRIRLTWYQSDRIPSIGDSWRFHVRLKRPRGYFESWRFRLRGLAFSSTHWCDRICGRRCP